MANLLPEEINALCSNCGAALKYVYYLNGKPLGCDCFERLTGLKFYMLAGHVDGKGNIDLDGYRAKQASAKLTQDEAKAEHAARNAEITKGNAALIDELLPYAEFETLSDGYTIGRNFTGSIVCSLRNGERAADLPVRAKGIILDILCKGYRGKARAARYDAISDLMEDLKGSE